jgi:antitoxin CcdA
MTYRATITLDEEAYNFLLSNAKNNRSSFINELIKREKERVLEAALAQANEEESSDPDYQAELQDWDQTMTDGL